MSEVNILLEICEMLQTGSFQILTASFSIRFDTIVYSVIRLLEIIR